MFYIDDDIAYTEYKDYLSSNPCIISITDDIITTKEYTVKVLAEYSDLISIAEGLKGSIEEFDVSGYITNIVVNQGYKFITFGEK